MARQYYVEGTKSYLIAAWVLAGLSLWHIIDGWVPQARWRGAEPTAEISVNGVPFEISTREVGVRFNNRELLFRAATEWDADTASWPGQPVVWGDIDEPVSIYIDAGATLADFGQATAENRHFKLVIDEEILAGDIPVASLISQSVRLTGGRDGKYPNFPEQWNDFSLQEFYAYNRWTSVILGIAAIVCAYIHRVVR